jgi:hypothetical protein
MHWANFSNGASRENNENKDFANEAIALHKKASKLVGRDHQA